MEIWWCEYICFILSCFDYIISLDILMCEIECVGINSMANGIRGLQGTQCDKICECQL